MKALYSTYWSLGEGKGIKVSVFQNFLELRRIERSGNEWKEVQKIALPRMILEKLFVRIPKFHALMEDKHGDEAEEEA